MDNFEKMKAKLVELYPKDTGESCDFWIRTEIPPLGTLIQEMHRLESEGIHEMIIPCTREHFGTMENPMMKLSEVAKIPPTPYGSGVFTRKVDCSFTIKWG